MEIINKVINVKYSNRKHITISSECPIQMVENQGLRQLKLKSEYNTDDDDIIGDLYGPCLKHSYKYDRAVGYFRASIYRELGEDLLDFVIKGGKVRIVCSPDIPEQDEMAARDGYALRGTRETNLVQIDLLKVLETMSNNPQERDCLEMLRLLIEMQSLELFIAMRTGGIYHRKIGMFTDEFDNKVVFSGSGNETSKAVCSFEDWVNDEDFDVFRSWGDPFEALKAENKSQHLQALLSGGTTKTKVRPLNQLERDFLARFRSYSSLEQCRPGAQGRGASFETFKTNIVPYYYQKQAIEQWRAAGRVGILSMATSTGKTYTALLAIEDLMRTGHPVLITVPGKILLKQWEKAINNVYGCVPILMAGGGYSWKSKQDKQIFVSKISKPRIVLSTMDTAASDDFIEFFSQAEHSILLADEVHALGSPVRRQILKIPFEARLGLSATPERLFDEEGSLALANAFGVDPAYELAIGDSVKLSEDDPKEVPILGTFLSPYEYLFRTIDFTPSEQKQWDNFTKEIKMLTAISRSKKEGPSVNDKQRLTDLLIKRSKIVKKAVNKVEMASAIAKELYPSNGKWIVYCEDEAQLDATLERLKREMPHKIILKYHSKMEDKDRQRVLDYFDNNPSIVVSIRCLDEGVDIPSANGAIILASSSNPRQYIQRRGRVLRRAKGKGLATIIDVLVTPESSEEGVPFSIIKSELARAWNFAKNATNREISNDLWQICFKYGVSTNEDAALGVEDETGE
jgi:superfamily II DNA or RNA helicase